MLATRVSILVACLILNTSSVGTDAQALKIQEIGPQQAIHIKIVGTLSDFEKAPIADAVIGIAPWRASVWQPLTKTLKDGSYSLTVDLQPGGYRLIAGLGEFRVADTFFDVAQREPSTESPRVINLIAEREDAQSDEAPELTPKVALLPPGDFPPSPKKARPPVGPPPPPAPGSQESVRVFYATNRVPLLSPGMYSSREIDQALHYGICTVSIPPTHQPGGLERPSIYRLELVEDVKKHIVITRRDVAADESSFRGQLATAFQQSGSEAFLFVHGYNVDFDDSVRRTAQLFRDLKFDGVPILFSWPGQDAWWRYTPAEDVVENSARQLERFLDTTFRSQRVSAVNIIAHSLGNRVLMAALERIQLRGASQDFRFDNIVLAAPDINIADFADVSRVLQASGNRATIYSSSHDVALTWSHVFHTFARLGEAPPTRFDRSIDTIDASAVPTDLLGHSYFGDSATVLKDLFLLLGQHLTPDKRFLEARTLGESRYWLVPNQ
jgi:esterase/lipase superfamily enzyme